MILGIETASTDTSVALAADDGTLVAVDGRSGDARQNGTLLPRVQALLGGRGLREVSRIGVGIGPGSFTGLRVGLSLAKGLAHALGVPIVGVPSLEGWLAAEPEADAALCRAGAREAYLLPRGETEPLVVEPDAAAELSQRRIVIAPAELVAAFGLVGTVAPHRAAAAVARLAAGAAPSDLASLEPGYGRPPRGLGPVPEGIVRWL
ncbi:MAG: tRNA (adenosine(37)-N6)-threonylcarbamoyltransferase complex dimerization subunit type 1 TsaB [Chloroflexota bacterium]